jgi:hypothetical protein
MYSSTIQSWALEIQIVFEKHVIYVDEIFLEFETIWQPWFQLTTKELL